MAKFRENRRISYVMKKSCKVLLHGFLQQTTSKTQLAGTIFIVITVNL